jgi:hypothetical protein
LQRGAQLPPGNTLEVDLGAQCIRIDLSWDIAEPAEGQLPWAPFDAVIDGAKSAAARSTGLVGMRPSHERPRRRWSRLRAARCSDVAVAAILDV